MIVTEAAGLCWHAGAPSAGSERLSGQVGGRHRPNRGATVNIPWIDSFDRSVDGR